MSKTASSRTYAWVCLTVAVLCLPAFGAKKGGAKTPANPILGKATYKSLEPGRFMMRWLVLGPIPVGQDESAGQSEQEQKKAFGTDPFSLERFAEKVTIDGKDHQRG